METVHLVSFRFVYLKIASSMSVMEEKQRELRDICDSLDSLHRRMDKFYEWAALLQKEFRDLQQRQGFIESQLHIDFFDVDNIQERLKRIKEKK